MAEPARVDAVDEVVRQAGELRAKGDYRGAIDRLTEANRGAHDRGLECALVDTRLEGAARPRPTDAASISSPIRPEPSGGQMVEVDDGRHERRGPAFRVRRGADVCSCAAWCIPSAPHSSLRASTRRSRANDAAEAGDRSVDPAWYCPRPIEDRAGTSRKVSRKIDRVPTVRCGPCTRRECCSRSSSSSTKSAWDGHDGVPRRTSGPVRQQVHVAAGALRGHAHGLAPRRRVPR